MPSFVKLDTGILVSTLWDDRDIRDVFLTALLMAEPWETTVPVAQLEVDSLKETGFVVPPGWYGFVQAAGSGILHRSLVEDRARGLEALRALGSPDAESRTPDHDGRRLVRVDGGYVVLNYIRYRDRDYTTAERSKRWRDRKKKLAAEAGATHRDDVTTRRVDTQAEGEADAEAHADAIPPSPTGPENGVPSSCRNGQDGIPANNRTGGPSGTGAEHELWEALRATAYRRNAVSRDHVLVATAKRLLEVGITPADLLTLARKAAARGKRPAGLFAHWIDHTDEALKELSKR